MIDPEARAGNPKENTASVSEEVNLPCHLLPELQLIEDSQYLPVAIPPASIVF